MNIPKATREFKHEQVKVGAFPFFRATFYRWAQIWSAENRLTLNSDDAAESLLAGYTAGIKAKGRPFVLEEDHNSLRSLAVSSLRAPTTFWKKMRELQRTLSGHWMVRRLGPYCSRIDMAVPRPRPEGKDILYAMGWETANIHSGIPRQIPAVRSDLRRRKSGWLAEAAALMTKETQKDWRDWCKGT